MLREAQDSLQRIRRQSRNRRLFGGRRAALATLRRPLFRCGDAPHYGTECRDGPDLVGLVDSREALNVNKIAHLLTKISLQEADASNLKIRFSERRQGPGGWRLIPDSALIPVQLKSQTLSSLTETVSITTGWNTPPLRRPMPLLARSLFLPGRAARVESPQPVCGAADPTSTSIQNMRVDYGRLTSLCPRSSWTVRIS